MLTLERGWSPLTARDLVEKVKEYALLPFDMCGYQPKISSSFSETDGGVEVTLTVSAPDSLAPFSVNSATKYLQSLDSKCTFARYNNVYKCFVSNQVLLLN